MTKFFLSMAYSGIDLYDEDQLEALAEAIPWVQWAAVDEEVRALVTREADTPVRAALDAVENIRHIIPTARFIRMVEDLVSVSDISRRVGVNRETVRKWATGDRGPGNFPRPRDIVGGNIQVWDWGSVTRWLCKHYAYGDERRPLTTEEIFYVQLAVKGYGRSDKPWVTATTWEQGPSMREKHVPNVVVERTAKSLALFSDSRFVSRQGVSIETISSLEFLRVAE